MRNPRGRRHPRRPGTDLRARFRAPLDPRALSFSESTREDLRLLPYDLWGSIAHARMLGETGILPRASAQRIEGGLRSIGAASAAGRFRLDPAFEDVHLNVETELTKRIGEDGERLHTARSRNDQVAVDLALYLRDALLDLEEACARASEALLRAARSPPAGTVVAGWTHLQPAQSVYWSQILGTHALRIVRDGERFAAIREKLTDSPLGSGALAGTSLPIDRHRTARWLGFRRPTRSSLDGVSDRDASAETVFATALTALHAAAISEELIVGSMPGVDRVRLHDAFVTTSSLMPHKRNPDLAELLRAESGTAVGRLAGLLGILKGLPIGYQRDLQAVKPILFESIDRCRASLDLLGPMVESAEFRGGTDAASGATGSVELVDALVRAGVPFRSAHQRVARYVSEAERAGAALAGLAPPPARFPELDGTGFTVPRTGDEPERRRSFGGSSRRQVLSLLTEVRAHARRLSTGAARERRRLRRLRAALGVPTQGGASPTPRT